MKISRYIDHAVLKPALSPEEVRQAIQLGIDYDVYTVCMQPRDVVLAAKMCKGTNTKVSAVVDFPHGAGGVAAKRAIAQSCLDAGAVELDMVMNYGAARGGEWDTVAEEIRAVVELAHVRGALVKVIFETCELTAEEIAKATEVSIQAGADFVKTSTGFAKSGATVEAVQIMLDAAKGRASFKPSGGIRSYADAKRYVDMGAKRLGVGFSTTPVLCKGEGESTETY